MSRQLQTFRPLPEKRPRVTDTDRRAILFKELVASKFWQPLKDEAMDIVSAYQSTIPTNPMQLIGYTTYSIVRDVLSQLFSEIENKASSAPNLDELLSKGE